MKNLKTFEEIQTSMDFTGNLSQEIMGRLNDAKDFFVKNLEETEEVEQTTKGLMARIFVLAPDGKVV